MTEKEREALVKLITEVMSDPSIPFAMLPAKLAERLEEEDFYYLPRTLPGETVRKMAAKTAVAASKRTGRPVDPRVEKLAK
jgi:hypothetical protein